MYNIENEYDIDPINKFLFITPVSRLSIRKKITLGDFSIYPKNSLNLDALFEYDFTFDKEQEILRNELKSYVLFVFLIDGANLKERGSLLSKGYDEEILDQAASVIKPLIDIFRYYYCEYNYPYSLPNKPGQIENGKCISFIKGNILTSKISISDRYNGKQILGNGLNIDSSEKIETCSLLKNDIGEVGNIVRHALYLNTSILEQDNLTAKFMQIMTLFEYLAFPYNYMPFQKVKTKICSHIANDNNEYLKLLDDFHKYTAKPGFGYRTEIVHNGKTIEDIIPNKQELINLFSELQFYVQSVIEDLLQHYNKDWSHIEKLRDTYIANIQNNNIVPPRKKFSLPISRNIVFIDVRYLWIKIQDSMNFYKKETFSLDNFLYFLIAGFNADINKNKNQVYIVLPNIRNTIKDSFIALLKKYDNKSIATNEYSFDINFIKMEPNKKFCDTVYGITKIKCTDGNRFFDNHIGFKNILLFADNSHCSDIARKIIMSDLNIEIRFCRNFNQKTKIDGKYLYLVSDYIVAQSIGVAYGDL